ncbi:MAG: accessory factor UbiK family protein [Deltaproteobacteria bacterium]|nr:accessory factor UbiK family protein [Deltaproteobacteria bacterium]
MADLLDKAVMIGLGLEKKAKEALEQLEAAGKAASEAKAAGAAPGASAPGLSAKQLIENKVVEDAVGAFKELLAAIATSRERFEKEAQAISERVMERLNVPTRTELDVVKEMVRVAREKTDLLEKRVEELERRVSATH